MRIGPLLGDLHRRENGLARHLLTVSDRHRSNHEVYHLGRDLAGWSQRHVRALAHAAGRHGVTLDPEPTVALPVTERLLERGRGLIGPSGDPAMLLLRDLRKIYTEASGLSVDWEMVAQAAMATKDAELLTLTQDCHPDTLRQMRWANATLKESSPQILVGTG